MLSFLQYLRFELKLEYCTNQCDATSSYSNKQLLVPHHDRLAPNEMQSEAIVLVCFHLTETLTVGVPILVALAFGGASVGYFLGRGAASSATPPTVDYKHANEPISENPRVNKDRGDGDSDAEADDGDLGRIQPEPTEECKLVRKELLTGSAWSLSLSRAEI